MIFEEISAGAISPQMPACKAVVINVGNKEEITGSLKELYSAMSYKVYIVNVTASKLKKTLERCAEAGVIAIVNCADIIPPVETWHPQRRYAATLVSPCSSSCPLFFADSSLYSFSNIGYQSYRYNPEILLQLQSRYFEEMRLGVLRDDITQCEPLVRDVEYAFIDMRSVRYSDYPCRNNSNPNGLYAEEICTIARYVGLSQNLKAVFLFGEPESGKDLIVCYKLIAEVVWHLCEGIAANIPENPADESDEEYFSKKIVSMGENGENITFVTSSTTQRWWMEIPVNELEIKYVPCSVNDYKIACTGEVPLKWLFFYQKYAL